MDSRNSSAHDDGPGHGTPLLEADSPFLRGGYFGGTAHGGPRAHPAALDELAAQSPFRQPDHAVLEHVLPEPARTPLPATAATRQVSLQVAGPAGNPLAGVRWSVQQGGTVFEGVLDAQGSTGALQAPAGRFDAAQPYRLHVEGHVCSIVSGAALVADDPAVEYGGQNVDWALADDARPDVREAFWKEYAVARKVASAHDVFRFLQHDHVMRRPVKMLARQTRAVFEARPLRLRLGPLVRYTDSGRALIWMELETPGLARIAYGKATAQRQLPGPTDAPAATTLRHGASVRVGGRHYALVCLDRLDPDTAYQYTVELGPQPASGSLPAAEADFSEKVFPRTLPQAVQGAMQQQLRNAAFGPRAWLFFRTLPGSMEAVRFAHGSCRKWPGDHGEEEKGGAMVKLAAPGPDMLEVFGQHCGNSKQWSDWPQFLLHTGDQIYADDVGINLGQAIARHRFASVLPGPRPTTAGDLAFGAWSGRFGLRYMPVEAADAAPFGDVAAATKLRGSLKDNRWFEVDGAIKTAQRARKQAGYYRNRAPLAQDRQATGMQRRMHLRLRVLNGLLWQVPVHERQVPRVDKQRGLLTAEVYRLAGDTGEPRLEYPSAGDTAGVHAADFAEYGALYEQAWTQPHSRKLLAHLPSYMIFDDHEVTDDWNADPGWMKIVHTAADPHRCWPATMTDALASYWVYQGWGNLAPEQAAADPRVRILDRYRQEGRDALPELRRLIHSRAVQTTAPGAGTAGKLDWHFALPTGRIPFLVVDLRTDRDVNGHGGLSAQRLAWLEQALQATASPMAFIVLPVPFLMPDPMLFAFRHPGFTAQLAGARSTTAFKRSSDIEHPADNPVWDQIRNLLQRLQQRQATLKTVAIVSGDIHFACNLDGQLPGSTRAPRLLQLVSSGLQQKISPTKQGQLDKAYKGWLNAISRAQGVDEHRGVRITLGGLQGPGGALRNFLFDTSIALVDARPVPAGPSNQRSRVPLIVQTHLAAAPGGKPVAWTLRHMTQANGTAVMSLKDPGFDHPASPKDYPAATGGIGLAKEWDGESGGSMAEPAEPAGDSGAFSAETSSLDPGQSIRIDGQHVRSHADAALWYAVRRAVLQEYRDAFVKERYQVPDGLDDLIAAADARAARLRKLGQAPLGDSSMVSTLDWLDAYLKVVYACDLKMDVIAADRYRATQAELERMVAQAERLKPQLRAAQRSAFRAGSNSKLKQAAETFATLLDNTLAVQELVRDGAAQLAEMRALGTTLRSPGTLRGAGQPWHELMRATTRAKLGKLLNAAQGLNKILAAWQLLDGGLALLAGGKTASDRTSGAVSFAATIASAGGTLLGASSVFSLYNNLYIGPMVKRILGQVDVLKDQLSTGRNHPYIQLGRLDNVDWSIEPGGREMFEFMRAAMKAGSATAMPSPPAAVARYFGKHKKAFDAGTPQRHGVDINHDDFGDKRQWVFAFRDDLWGMLYGALPVPG